MENFFEKKEIRNNYQHLKTMHKLKYLLLVDDDDQE